MTNLNYTLPSTDEILALATRELSASIARAEAEREKTLAERDKFVNEIEAQKAIIRQLSADAVIQECRAAEIKMQYTLDMSRDFHHQVYRFTDPVDEKTTLDAIDTLTAWDRIYPGKPFEIVFNSPGGSVVDGMDLFDFIQEMKRKGHFITTATRGWAASMGGILLQAGDKRVAGEESYVLIHEIAFMARGKTSEIEDSVAFSKLMQKRVLGIFERRSAEAFANGTSEIALTADQLENGDPELGIPGWSRREWWLDSADCLRFGIVDEVR